MQRSIFSRETPARRRSVSIRRLYEGQTVEIQQLKYFKKVAETGKISDAANALFISSPALSSSISRLEKELGVKLFDRMSNHIKLNKQGEILLRYVNQALNCLDRAKTELALSTAVASRKVRVAVTTSNLWIPLFSAFSLEYPYISLSSYTIKPSKISSIDLTGQHTFLLAESDDIQGLNLQPLHSQCLFTDEPLLMVNMNHPLAKRDSIDLKEIRDERLFLPTAGQSLSKRLGKLLNEAGIPTQNAYECANMVFQSMVEEGRGIAFSTKHTHVKKDDGISYIPIVSPACRWQLFLCWHGERRLTDEELAFKEFVDEFYSVNETDAEGNRDGCL